MKPVSLRARLTAAFAAATVVVLAAVGLIVYFQFATGVTKATDAGLKKRQQAVLNLVREGDSPAELQKESGERLIQLYGFDGALVRSSRAMEGTRLLAPADVRRAVNGPVSLERERVADGDEARVRAFPVADQQFVVAIGESLAADHDLRLRLVIVLAIALPGALILASYLGYRVAGAALNSVERMRAQAAQITETDLASRLPVPQTGDELESLGVTFNALLDRLSGAMERERRVVSDASHELRTPLAVLRAELEVASRPHRTHEQLQEAISSALEETRRLSRLAEDLLVLARADQGQMPLRKEPLDVADVLAEVARRHATAVATAGRELVTAVDIEGGAVILADPSRVTQALDNLIANAIDHGEGRIDVRATTVAGNRVALAVADEGSGIPEDFVDRAFERFSQADHSHGGQGSGLGLAIVDAIARAHGGAVHAGDGAVVIELPAA